MQRRKLSTSVIGLIWLCIRICRLKWRLSSETIVHVKKYYKIFDLKVRFEKNGRSLLFFWLFASFQRYVNIINYIHGSPGRGTSAKIPSGFFLFSILQVLVPLCSVLVYTVQVFPLGIFYFG